MSTGLAIVIFLLMVAWSAFFVAAEFALVVARPTRMRELAEQGNARAARVLKRGSVASSGASTALTRPCQNFSGDIFAALGMTCIDDVACSRINTAPK